MERLAQSTDILILGATGKIGSQAIQFFSNAGIPCNALTRDLSKVKPLPFVNWVQGDLNDKEKLPTLLNGVKKIFLNTTVVDNMKEMQCTIIDTAKAAGVEYIVKLSTPSASPTAVDKPGKMHWEIEEHLKQSGLQWNILRPQSFMQNWLGDLASTVRTERKIYAAAGEGKKAVIDTRDIGEVVFTLLQNPGVHNNNILSLSGPKAISFYELADAITNVIGEKVMYISQSAEEATVRMQKRGAPEWAIQLTLMVERNQQSGAAEKAFSKDAEEILQKPGRTITGFIKDHAQAFQ